MSNEVLRFALRRRSDDLVYGFARTMCPDGGAGFKRADGDCRLRRSRQSDGGASVCAGCGASDYYRSERATRASSVMLPAGYK
ncbi:hypothetical protein [Bradyrhizobium sp. HKCCYLS20291]|uniref:hypothetical protein n=1 Tax=Bradyrhizobium sp. HKCCYLS20291 TaxID=3420766 RepID=UPI003EB6D1F6